MATKLQIMQGAFVAMTGGDLLDEQDPNGAPILGVYDFVADAACIAQRWPWTIRRIQLTNRDPATGQPERYRFTMPAGILDPNTGTVTEPRLSVAPIALFVNMNERRPMDDRAWRVSGQHIYTDQETLWGLFQFRTPETTWPAQFVEYMRLLLIAETVAVYKPDTGLQDAEVARNRAKEKEGELANTTAQVLGAEPMFEEFATTSTRFGGGIEYEPIALNEDGRAL